MPDHRHRLLEIKFGVAAGMPASLALFIAAAIVITYTAAGGMWAVALTDLIQVVIVAVGLLVMFPVVVAELGGWQAIATQLSETVPRAAPSHVTSSPLPARMSPEQGGRRPRPRSASLRTRTKNSATATSRAARVSAPNAWTQCYSRSRFTEVATHPAALNEGDQKTLGNLSTI